MIYLDNAATTQVCPEAAQAAVRAMTLDFGNPSSRYPLGKAAASAMAAARSEVAAALGCGADEVFFTSCGTEGDNWAIQAALWQNRRVGKHIVTTAVEHSAILQPCQWLTQQGCEVTYVVPDSKGNIPAECVLAAVRPDTALVSVMLVNNELGTVYPIREIAQGLKAKNPQTLLHTDAVQAFLKVPFSARTLGADLISLSAHKIGGPKGIGALCLGPRMKNVKPLLPGGGQEHGLRSGTEATAQIAGFAKAVELRQANLTETIRHMAEIKAYAIEQLTAIPDLVLVGDGQAPHVLAVSLVGWPSQNIVNDLSAQGICVSAGSACHQGKPSQVVAALKLPKRVASGVIRLSFGPETTKADIDACAAALRRHHDTRFPMF